MATPNENSQLELATDGGLPTTTCSASSGTPEAASIFTVLEATFIAWAKGKLYTEDVQAVLSHAKSAAQNMERERDEARKKLSYKTQTWLLAEGTIREQFQRIGKLEVEVMDLKRSAEANGAIWDKSRERTLNITRKCCDAIGVLKRGGEDQAMLAELREILLPNA